MRIYPPEWERRWIGFDASCARIESENAASKNYTKTISAIIFFKKEG